MTLSEELTWRGFVNQTTFADIKDLDETPRTFYLGVDPSARSMHIGNLAAVMLVKHLIAHGHKAIVLVGGATGMIGDPKEDAERELKTLDEIERNKAGIAANYKKLLEGESFTLVDNYDWFKTIGYLEFLRDVGKHFSMTQLLDREFIKARIGEGGVGISYAEFSYSLIQGYDFLHLFREKGATLQIGGSDQWGNMLSGAQMIKKLEGTEAHVLTVPLIIDAASGKKFGKSEGNAVWLDAEMMSPYKFYQFWLNLDDITAKNLIKIFTLLEKNDIEDLIREHDKAPHLRKLQTILAQEATVLVHGRERNNAVQKVTHVLFNNATDLQLLSDEELELLSVEIPTVSAATISEALLKSGLCSSNGEVRRLLEGGGVSVNGEKVTEDRAATAPALIKKGKNSFVLVR